MRHHLFTAIFFVLPFLTFSQNLTVEFPAILVSNISQEIKIENTTNTTAILETPNGQQALTVGTSTIYYQSAPGKQASISIDGKTYKSSARAIPLWLSIIPPVLAIFLAFLTKEIILSLVGGIFIGTATIGFYSNGLTGIFNAFFKIITDYQVPALTDPDHIAILLFTFFISGMIAVISKNGGVVGMVKVISKYAKNNRSSQLTTYLLGLIIFFDDYMNSLVIGNAMRPIMDKMKVSREKLSYIVDSTAAPLVAISLIGVWIGAELDYIQSGLVNINNGNQPIEMSAYQILLSSLQFSFYPILTLIFVLMLILSGKDYGPMLHFENRARSGVYLNDQTENALNDSTYEPNEVNASHPNKWFALLPILTLIITVMAGILITGYSAEAWNSSSGLMRISAIMGSSDSFRALLWSSFLALTLAILMSILSKRMKAHESIESALAGFKDVLPVSGILVLAWCLAQLTEEMHTADFVISLLTGNVPPHLIPAITFVLAGIIAFATGTSWGTMAILYPLMLPTSYVLSIEYGLAPEHAMDIFLISTASVLAGAVFGDHCSPISDTTILSSLASGCNHINHVNTQITYALTVGGVALVFGILPASFQVSSLITIPISVIVLYLIIRYFGKAPKAESK
ncbi:Na+/H+ antiporter NhaC family protein [Marinoscillum sp. MHG1-6]|uniref:Na+/H+ antiporter NhaC family protein n=1 Tax=Marinoscillum sp. MHG1-6 TaxID=2959627 RepID=UPI0021579E68|nr:Na+/H+ antiporter NhaC family protein [Marinoscillum sp. MHG1-6]